MAWNSNNSFNKFTDMYVKGIIDISGNGVICRNGNLVLGSYTLTPTILNYLSTISSDIQQQVTNLAATCGGLVSNTQYIAYSGGTTTVSSPLAFTSTLNGVLPSTFAYISTLSSNAQSQINTANANINTATANIITTNTNVSALSSLVTGHTASINSLNSTVTGHTVSIGTLTTTVNGHTTSIASNTSAIASNTTNLTNITYNPFSTYNDMVSVYIGNYLISEGCTLKNTVSITGSLSVNSQTVSNTQLGYLSNLSGDVQSAIDNLNTKTTGISAGGGGYTNINFLDVTDYLYSATGSQLDGTTLINGPLSISTTGSILANSLTISPTVLSYLANVTSDIQAQISGISTSNFVTINSSQTITGNKIFNGTVTLNNITANSIPNSALQSSYLQLSTAQTCAGIKTFTGNCVFSNNPSFSGNPSFTGIPTFVNATFTGTAANSPTFASLYSNYLQVQSTAAGTGLIFNNGGSSTTAGGFLWSRYTTPTNPATQIGDMELGINQGASTNGLSIGFSTATSNGIRLLPNSITFNSPITITGNITANSQTITTAQLGYLSGGTQNINTAVTGLQTTVSSHTSSITALQSATTYISTSTNNEVQMNAPIKLYSPTLQPSGNQLGTYQQSWYTGSGNISTTTQNVCSITLSPGTYLMTILYDIYHTTGGASEQVTASVSTVSANHAVAQSGRGPYNQFYPGLTAAKESQQYTMWVSNASGGNTTYYFVITLSTAAVMTNQSFMDATRIA